MIPEQKIMCGIFFCSVADPDFFPPRIPDPPTKKEEEKKLKIAQPEGGHKFKKIQLKNLKKLPLCS
jgi:hypothetical protein